MNETTLDWIQNSVKSLCCTCWYEKLSKTVWIIHCFCLLNYYVINLFLDQCYFLCHFTSYIGWEIKFALNWNLSFISLLVIVIRGAWCKSLIVVLENKFHYYFCQNVWHHSKVNKTLLVISIKSSNFVQSCSLGIQAMETSLTFILNDTIRCTSFFYCL